MSDRPLSGIRVLELGTMYAAPTAGRDPVVSDSINLLIRRLQRRFGVTSLVVTHDMKSAFDVADRIAYLKLGKIYFEGTSSELQASPAPDIQDFIAGRSNRAQVVEDVVETPESDF